MQSHMMPLAALSDNDKELQWHDARVKNWIEVYKTLGIVRPLVVALGGRVINPPGELAALRQMKASNEYAPAGVMGGDGDWLIPVWLVDIDEEAEALWQIVLSGGVDHNLITRARDVSVVDILLTETEGNPNRAALFGLNIAEYIELLETISADEEETPVSPISGSDEAAYYGIPTLDPALQVTTIDPALAVKWGQKSRSTLLDGLLVHFYTEDMKFSALVSDAEPVIKAHPAGAIEVNLSTAPTMPRAIVLHNIYQKRTISRRWQQAGLPLLVDLNVDYEFADINLIGVPRGWRAYATRAHAKDLAHTEKAYTWAVNHRGSDDVLFVVYGGGKRAQELCAERGWTWINEEADQRRGRYGTR